MAMIAPIKILGNAPTNSLLVIFSVPSPFPVLATINRSILKMINPQIIPKIIDKSTVKGSVGTSKVSPAVFILSRTSADFGAKIV